MLARCVRSVKEKRE